MTVYTPLARLGKRKGTMTPSSNFHLAAEHRVIIEIEDDVKETLIKTQATLEEINAVLQKLANSDKSTSQIIPEALENPVEPLECDEPKELSVNVPGEFVEPDNPFGTIISAADVKWNKVKEFPLFDWREDDKILVLRYSRISHDTNWKIIKDVLEFTGSKRTEYITKIIGSKTSKKITAFRIFCRCIENGTIKLPFISPDEELDSMYTKFSQEVDPDKPMLSGLNLTRVKENCGNGEAC